MSLRPTRMRWIAAIIAIAMVAVAAHGLGAQRAEDSARAKAESDLALLADNFRVTVDKFQQTPVLLAANAKVMALLDGVPDAATVDAANRYLEMTAERLGAAQLFVMRPDGLTIAASYWRGPDSLVGQNYAFRPYFREALASGSGTFYGVGVTTGLPGYFLSSDIRHNGRLVGVAVVKIDLVPLEDLLARRSVPVLIADGDGVVILASDPALKYRPLRELTEQQKIHIAAERRFARHELGPPLSPRDLKIKPPVDVVSRVLPIAEGGTNWSIVTYLPAEDIADSARFAALLAALVALAGILGATIFTMRRRHLAEERAAKRNLEARVEMRTIELRRAYQELAGEIAERKRIDRQLHQTRDDLAQAAKLAAMGQAFSGLAHEINQPLMALKTYLASLGKLVERQDSKGVASSLAVMNETVERMSELTNSLRRLARKADRRIEPVDLAVLARQVGDLMKFRLADIGATFRVEGAPSVVVAGDSNRLQQVILNLVMNAMDAVAEVDRKEIRISLSEKGGLARLAVHDTGKGIAPEVSNRLGEPFFTTKDVGKGLGLGLAISHAIVAEHAGNLVHESDAAGGAIFVVMLPARPVGQTELTERPHAAE